MKTDKSQAFAGKRYVGEETISMRATPGFRGHTKETIDYGKEVHFTGNKETLDGIDWAEVEYGGKTGWVLANSLRTEVPDSVIDKNVPKELIIKQEKNAEKRTTYLNKMIPEWMTEKGYYPTKYDYGLEEILSGLMFAVHGWTESKVDVENFILADDGTYTASLKFIFMDNFGLDEDDVKEFGFLPGFRSWYVLQHYDGYKEKYKPFKTVVTIDYPISGKISGSKK